MWQYRYQYVWTVYGWQLVPVQVWVPQVVVTYPTYINGGNAVYVPVLPYR